MSYTLITHFDECGYISLNEVFAALSDEKYSRVPYGRVDDKSRYVVDTLPYHFTVTSSTETLTVITQQLKGLNFKPFELIVAGVDLMPGKGGSKVLYFKVKPSKDMDMLQEETFKRVCNPKYKPIENTLHLTIAISKDSAKIERIRHKILSNFNPFSLRIVSLGLYEIWPGKLKVEYHSIND